LEDISNVKGTCDFTHTAAAGWMKIPSATSSDPEEELEELDVVELVAAEDVMATGKGVQNQIDLLGVVAHSRGPAARG